MVRRFDGRTLAWALGALLVVGCADDDVDFGDEGGNADAVAPQADGGGGPPAPTPDMFVPPANCNAYTYRESVYDCSTLDKCTEQNFEFRLACCECDPRFCNAQPGECAPAPDAAPPPNPPPGDGGVQPPPNQPPPLESCMNCHNGSQRNDYSGSGLSNPHPFPGAENISCSGCHGGNPAGNGRLGSHVPAPPDIGDRAFQANNEKAFFNRRTLAGIDKLEPATFCDVNGDGVGEACPPDYQGPTYTNTDWLQFINPGDLRVVGQGKGCGAEGCHFNKHAQWVPRSPIATTTGFFSATRFLSGIENRIAEYRGRDMDGDSLADSAPRAVSNPAYNAATREVGEVGRLVEQPEKAGYRGEMYQNGIFDAATLANHLDNTDPARPNRVRYGSPLETLIDEQVSITCGDCHLYSAGQNDRYADFRGSGCTACHMEYSYDGRSRSGDPNVPRNEPANPDAIAAGERAHVEAHQIRNVAKILPNGAFVRGISDRACVGCHQGSNRTVLQFWGIRLDQNQDLTNNFQYPQNPANFQNTAQDDRLYDPGVNNNTFNGRNANQHILFEDYDNDQRDDTPPDVHYEAGMGCIDCHGSRDLHGGTEGDPTSGQIRSRQNQVTTISCESCHGGIAQRAGTGPCTTYDGRAAECVQDREGNALRHVTKDAAGDYWLVSRVSGQRHYIPQVHDVVVDNNKRNPLNSRLIYNPRASYAMGRADGNDRTGIGPNQADPNLMRNRNFSHTDNMDCASCHASWTNNCIGCHLKTQYDVDPNNYFFSNITGERILLFQANADFVYQSPVMMYLGINSRGKITQISPAEKFFYRYQDLNGVESEVLAFGDRLGEGNNPVAPRNAHPSLAMNQMMPHSIRGKVTQNMEGPRYCVTCHLNTAQIDQFGAQYADFRNNYYNRNYNNLDFNLLQQHIGENTGNQLNSPFFVHMTAGLGTGLFLFDANGCPQNPLDDNPNRENCNDVAPAQQFNANNVAYDLDRVAEITGVPNASSAHPRLTGEGPQRIGASNPEMAGPMDAQRLQMMTDPNVGLVLDSWLDANGAPQGGAANFLQ